MARLFPWCCLKFALNHCQPVRTGLQTGSDMFRFLAILALAFGLFPPRRRRMRASVGGKNCGLWTTPNFRIFRAGASQFAT